MSAIVNAASRTHTAAVRLTVAAFVAIALITGVIAGLVISHLPAAEAAEAPVCAVLCGIDSGSGAVGNAAPLR